MSEYGDAKSYFQRLVNFSSASVYKDMLHHAIAAFDRAEKAEAEVAWLLTQVSGLRDREAELLAEVDRWRNNSDNSQLQVGDLEAQTVSMQRWIDHHNQRADKAERILEEGVRMAAAMNMTAGWVDSAKQILGGKS